MGLSTSGVDDSWNTVVDVQGMLCTGVLIIQLHGEHSGKCIGEFLQQAITITSCHLYLYLYCFRYHANKLVSLACWTFEFCDFI